MSGVRCQMSVDSHREALRPRTPLGVLDPGDGLDTLTGAARVRSNVMGPSP